MPAFIVHRYRAGQLVDRRDLHYTKCRGMAALAVAETGFGYTHRIEHVGVRGSVYTSLARRNALGFDACLDEIEAGLESLVAAGRHMYGLQLPCADQTAIATP